MGVIAGAGAQLASEVLLCDGHKSASCTNKVVWTSFPGAEKSDTCLRSKALFGQHARGQSLQRRLLASPRPGSMCSSSDVSNALASALSMSSCVVAVKEWAMELVLHSTACQCKLSLACKVDSNYRQFRR